MPSILYTEEFLELIQKNQRIQSPDLSQKLYHSEIASLIKHEWFTYDLRNISIREGLQFNISQVTSHTNYTLEMPMQYDVIGFTYGLEGNTSMSFEKSELIDLPTGTSIVYRLSAFDIKGYKRYQPGSDVHFSIHFTLEAFREMLDLPQSKLPEAFKIFAYGQGSGLYQTNRLSEEVKQILKELLNIDQTGLSRQFFVESKVLELISIQLEYLTGTSCQERFSPQEEKLQKCRNLLIDNFSQPPSLIDLTKEVGINLCDLKIGFKKMFGTSPYQYLKNYRLEQAYKMLDDGMTVNAVADEIGYSSIGSFSNAFFEKFNRRPSRV